MSLNHMLQKEIDKQTSTQWAIASLSSAGAGAYGVGGAVTWFELVNLATGRAHQLEVAAAGMSLGLPASASLSRSDYFSFKTRHPVKFMDFDGDGAHLFDASVGWRSVTQLVIFEGDPFSITALTYELASVWIDGGWGFSLPGVDGLRGYIKVLFGSGTPSGDLTHSLVPSFAPKPEDEDLPVKFSSDGREDALDFDVAGDALFDFDHSDIKPAAEKVLTEVGKAIRSRRPKRVVIYGYTDSIGDEAYNDALSDRRAKAVQRWLAGGNNGATNYLKGADVEASGRGTDNPAVDNTDRRNTPANRERQKENRRIAILLIRR